MKEGNKSRRISNVRKMDIKGVRVMLLNTTLNNISVILWRSFLLVVKAGIPGENHQPSHRQTLWHNVVSSKPQHGWDSNLQL